MFMFMLMLFIFTQIFLQDMEIAILITVKETQHRVVHIQD